MIAISCLHPWSFRSNSACHSVDFSPCHYTRAETALGLSRPALPHRFLDFGRIVCRIEYKRETLAFRHDKGDVRICRSPLAIALLRRFTQLWRRRIRRSSSSVSQVFSSSCQCTGPARVPFLSACQMCGMRVPEAFLACPLWWSATRTIINRTFCSTKWNAFLFRVTLGGAGTEGLQRLAISSTCRKY